VDAVDTQIQELRARWSVDQFERQKRKDERRDERLQRAKDRLLSGEWKPNTCPCDQCLRCIIEKTAPEGLCAVGLTAGQLEGIWWR
jgi:hypothetical protein